MSWSVWRWWKTTRASSAFEATQGLGVGVAGGESAVIVGLSEALEADLSDGDAV